MKRMSALIRLSILVVSSMTFMSFQSRAQTVELIWQNSGDGVAAAWYGDGSGDSTTSFDLLLNGQRNNSTAWLVRALGDLNNDGQSDIVWQNVNNGLVAVWYRQQNASFNDTVDLTLNGQRNTSLEWMIAGIGDLNGDDKPDLIWQNVMSGAAKVWYGRGTQDFGSSADLTYSGQPNSMLAWKVRAAADLNKDGIDDIIWQNESTGVAEVWYADSPYSFPGATNNNYTRYANLSLSNNSISISMHKIRAALDINGDRNVDLILQNESSGSAIAWIGNGSASFQSSINLTYNGNPNSSIAWKIVSAAILPADCLSPSSGWQALAQSRLKEGKSVCLTEGDFFLTWESYSFKDGGSSGRRIAFPGLVVDGTAAPAKKNISITGAGRSRTRLHYNGCFTAIALRGTIENLEISRLSIIGSTTDYYVDTDQQLACTRQLGIYDSQELFESPTGVRVTGARFHDLAFENLRNGISLNGGCNPREDVGKSCYCVDEPGKPCSANNTIANNTVAGIYGSAYLYQCRDSNGLNIKEDYPKLLDENGNQRFGGTVSVTSLNFPACKVTFTEPVYKEIFGTGMWTDQSSGVAIGVQNQGNLTIRGNFIDNVSRHQIYIARGEESFASFLVEGNVLSRNRLTGFNETTPYWDYNGTALVIARSARTTARHNKITNTPGIGISVEYGLVEDSLEREVYFPSCNVVLENNVFTNVHKDLWLNIVPPERHSPGSVRLSGNIDLSNGTPAEADCLAGEHLSQECNATTAPAIISPMTCPID